MSEEPNLTLTGGCSCGAIRFAVSGAPVSIAACHCADCRRHTGAPASVYVDVARDQLAILAGQVTWFETSKGAERGFCARCGATLAFRGANLPDMVHLHVGAFDQPETLAPAHNERTQSRMPWIGRLSAPE